MSDLNHYNPQIRKTMRKKRQQLALDFRRRAAIELKDNLIKSKFLQLADKIAVYLSFDNEISLEPLVQHLWQQGKSCYLPVLHPIIPRQMWFVLYAPDSRLKPNKFNILEPEFQLELLLAPWELDVILAPVVAFDDNKARIGMGGGFYDISFRFMQLDKTMGKPQMIGCAYACQRIGVIIDTEPHDLYMDYIATEQDII